MKNKNLYQSFKRFLSVMLLISALGGVSLWKVPDHRVDSDVSALILELRGEVPSIPLYSLVTNWFSAQLLGDGLMKSSGSQEPTFSNRELNPDEFADALSEQIDKDPENFENIMKATLDILNRYFDFGPVRIFTGLPEDIAADVEEIPYSEPLPAATVPLYHPNGEILSWGMFYKFLHQKVVGGEPLPQGVSDTDWFKPYERWFRLTYPQFEDFDPAGPADSAVVYELYGDLPPGVSFDSPRIDASYGDESLSSLPSDLSAYLLHPNGEVLSWAMFYKMAFQKKTGMNDLPLKASDTDWYQPYERWFRNNYVLPRFKAADPAEKEIVIRVYGSLPPGVSEILAETPKLGMAVAGLQAVFSPEDQFHGSASSDDYQTIQIADITPEELLINAESLEEPSIQFSFQNDSLLTFIELFGSLIAEAAGVPTDFFESFQQLFDSVREATVQNLEEDDWAALAYQQEVGNSALLAQIIDGETFETVLSADGEELVIADGNSEFPVLQDDESNEALYFVDSFEAQGALMADVQILTEEEDDYSNAAPAFDINAFAESSSESLFQPYEGELALSEDDFLPINDFFHDLAAILGFDFCTDENGTASPRCDNY